MAVNKIISIYAAVLIFHLTALIVIWIYAPMLLFRIKIMLKPIIDRNSIRIHISKEEIPAIIRFSHVSQHSSGRVRVKPPQILNEEACPIMFANISR